MPLNTNFSDNQAYRLINNVIDQRIGQLTRSGAGVDITWGTVASVDSPYECSVYLFGENVPSAGFRLENGLMPNYLDPVRVAIDKRGNRWIEGILSSATDTAAKMQFDARGGRLRLLATDDLNLTSTLHAFQVGPSDGQNIAIDTNEIMARNNNASSELHLNTDGGIVIINQNNGSTASGLKIVKGGLRLGTSVDPGDDTGILLGADVLLFRSAANVLSLGQDDVIISQNEAWIAPTLINSWANYGSGFNTAGYRRDAQGYIHLKGMIRNGVLGQPMFVLPTGYQPAATLLLGVPSNNAFGRIDISTTGNVTPHATAASNVYISLDGISFKRGN